MNTATTLRSLRDQRRSLLAWSLGFAGLIAMYASIWPSLAGNRGYADVIDQMPEAVKTMFSATGSLDLATPAGYMTAEFASLLGPLLLAVYAIGVGANAVAGEESAGTLELVLSRPTSRTRFALEKLLALLAGVFALMAIAWVALVIASTAANMALSLSGVTAMVVGLGLVGLEIGAVAFAVGAATGRPGVAKAVAALVAVLAYLLNGLGPLVSALHTVRKISPFYAYLGSDPLRHGLSAGFVAVLIASTVVITALGIAAFRRRDLRV